MYQGKFDSKNKRTTVDVSELLAQRNSEPAREQPPRQPVRENPPKANPARTQQPARQPSGRQSQPTTTRQPSAKRPQTAQAMPEKRRKGPRLGGVIFYTLYFMFILVFFVATFFGLQWLQGWLTDYQAAQPTTKSQEVFDQLFSHPDWSALYDAAGVEDTPYEGKEQFVAYMENKVGDSALTFKETSAGLSGDKKYLVFLGDEKIASFTLSGQTAAITDIPDWELGKVELIFDRADGYLIQIVDGHTAFVNGVALDDSFVIQITSSSAADYLPVGTTGAKTDILSITGLMMKPTVTVKDQTGADMPVSYDEEKGMFVEQTESNTITEEEQTAVTGALKAYGEFMINASGARASLAKYYDTSADAYKDILKIGSELVLGCSELWAFGIDHPSAGMAAEIELAKAHGIPVRNGFEAISELKPDEEPENNEEDESDIGSVTLHLPAFRAMAVCNQHLDHGPLSIELDGRVILELADRLISDPGVHIEIGG